MTTTLRETPTLDARETFYSLVPELLRQDDRLAVVTAEIGKSQIVDATPESDRGRIINVGIREQLAISVAGGLALAGVRPLVHTFPPFLIERPYEQIKLDIDHQGVGAVLVSGLGSYGAPTAGQTHFGHRDVTLLDSLDNWTVHVPGHPAEAEILLRRAIRGDDRVYVRLDPVANSRPIPDIGDGTMRVLRQGNTGTVIAVGPTADRVLAATEGRDLTVLYAATIRPFDADTLLNTLSEPDILVVEPYQERTSVPVIGEALRHVRARIDGVGVRREELRRYGTIEDHDHAHGLDITGIRRRTDAFFTQSAG